VGRHWSSVSGPIIISQSIELKMKQPGALNKKASMRIAEYGYLDKVNRVKHSPEVTRWN
jgi:hypothetical protein